MVWESGRVGSQHEPFLPREPMCGDVIECLHFWLWGVAQCKNVCLAWAEPWVQYPSQTDRQAHMHTHSLAHTLSLSLSPEFLIV